MPEAGAGRLGQKGGEMIPALLDILAKLIVVAIDAGISHDDIRSMLDEDAKRRADAVADAAERLKFGQ